MGEMSRRDFNKALASGFVGAGAGLALGGEALAEKSRPNPNYRLTVLDFGYEGPTVAEYNNRPRAIREMFANKLELHDVPLRDPGTVIGELEFRGIDYERFLEYPGIVASFDPKSNFLRDTDAVIGMCTDYDMRDKNYFGESTPDSIIVRLVDLESGNVIKTLERRGDFERGSMDKMMNYLAENIADEFRRIRDGY